MASKYVLQIVELETGHVSVRWPPGRQEETDLISAICARAKAKGVGALRSEAHVLTAFAQSMLETFHAAKSQVQR